MSYAKRLSQLTVCVILSCFTQQAAAQKIEASHTHLSTEDGLCSNTVSGIYQDDLGYIWLATWNGLSRYDGYNFYNYRTGNSSRIKNLHNRIFDMAIDQSQNIWLRMYDGRVFVLDRSSDKIINPFESYDGHEDFRSRTPILTTSTGETYVCIDHGDLYVMQLGHKGLKSKQVKTNGLKINCMCEGLQDDILLGTTHGIYRLQHDSLSISKEAVLPNEDITCLHSSGYGIYTGTSSGSIFLFSNGLKPTQMRKPSGMAIYSIFVDSHKLIWFCDDRMGAYRLNPENGNEKFFEQEVPSPEYDGRGGSFNESNGIVWVRMNHGGYGYYNREQDVVENFHNNPSNPWDLSNTINAALELPEGVVWESTNRRGLEKLEIVRANIVREKLVPHSKEVLDNEIRAIYYDQRRKLLLLGNKSGDLYLKYDNGTQTVISSDDQGNKLRRLYGISKDSKGNYWICSKDNGLYKMTASANSWTLKNFRHQEGDKQSLSSNSAYLAVEDKFGNIWIATYGGGVNLLRQEGGKTVFIHPGNGMTSYPKEGYMKVRTLATDLDGNVWAGTTDGILIMSYRNKKLSIEELKMPEESDKVLMSNDIVCIRHDNRGTMWVGTNGGGISYTIGKDKNGAWMFDTFDTQDGLPSDEIRSITFDQQGNAWLATEHAICSFDINKKIFTTFSSLDGVDETIISEGGSTCTGDGHVLFGTLNGYYIIDRQKLINSKGSVLKLQITDFFIDEKMQSPRLNDTYDYYVPNSKKVEINGNDNFAFRFAAMNYQLQHRIHYQYMLEGYDEDWQNAKSDRVAYFKDVPSGIYTFKVRAFLLESPEKYDQRTITVVVHRPILTSPTAFGIYFLLLFVAVVLIFVKYRKAKRELYKQ